MTIYPSEFRKLTQTPEERIEDLERSIQRAREILEASSGMEGSVEDETIQRALDALEGK